MKLSSVEEEENMEDDKYILDENVEEEENMEDDKGILDEDVEEEENMEDDKDILDEDVVVVKDMVNSDTDSNIEDLNEAEMTINDDGLIIRRGEDEVHSAGPKLIRRWKRQYQRFQELLCILRDDEEEEEFNYLFEKFTGDSLAARVINRMNTSTATAALSPPNCCSQKAQLFSPLSKWVFLNNVAKSTTNPGNALCDYPH